MLTGSTIIEDLIWLEHLDLLSDNIREFLLNQVAVNLTHCEGDSCTEQMEYSWLARIDTRLQIEMKSRRRSNYGRHPILYARRGVV